MNPIEIGYYALKSNTQFLQFRLQLAINDELDLYIFLKTWFIMLIKTIKIVSNPV